MCYARASDPDWLGFKSTEPPFTCLANILIGISSVHMAALPVAAGAVPFGLGALAIDYGCSRVTEDGRAEALTAREYEICASFR